MRETDKADSFVGVLRILVLAILLLSFCKPVLTQAKSELPRKNVEPVSLCPSSCTCLEQKPKLLGGVEQDLNLNEDEANLNVKSKGKQEILKNGIKVQCQNPAFISTVKKLNLPVLLIENVVQLDLSGNNISSLSADDFSNGNYLMLQRLLLKNNLISDISPDSLATLKNLKILDLSNNQLTSFSSKIVEHMNNLERIKLNGNPLNCDCRFAPLLDIVSSQNIKLQGTCSEPANLKDRSLSRLAAEELTCPEEEPLGIEIRPNTNQIVFEGDPLKLACKLKTGRAIAPNWFHRNINNQTATVSSGGAVEVTLNSRGTDHGTITESQLLIRQLLPRHGGNWMCSFGGKSASVEVTVLSLTTPTCVSQVTVSNKGRYSWPRTMANLKIVLPCQANPHLQTFRLCGATGIWEEPDLNSCYYLSEVTKVLEQFAKTNLTFSKTSALESARRLKSYLTDVVSLTDPHEAIFVTQTLQNYLDASSRHPELIPMIMDIYSILIKQDPVVLADSRHGLVGLLQQAPLKVPDFEYQSSGLAMEKCIIASKSSGVCSWRRTADKLKNRNRFHAVCGQNSSETVETSVRVPLIADGVFTEQSIILSLILSINPFVKSQPLATPVLGVTSGHTTNLINRTTPFIVTMKLNRPVGPNERIVGARWNQYTDQWNADQCQTLRSSDTVTFQCCCGFGYFAAFTTEEIEEEVTAKAAVPVSNSLQLLPSPVYVGSVIGLLCHLTAFLCYVIHRRHLKMTQPTRHALMNSWLSVALLTIVFTLGVRPVLGKFPCQITGLLLHYFTLSSLLWMVVNASSLYKNMSKSSRSDPEMDSSLMEEALAVGHDSPTKPALRFYLIGWGIPLIVVGIAGAIHLEQYHSSKICFLARTPAMGAVGLPGAILILLILTFHLLSWCYLRHTARLAAIQQKQLAVQQTEEPVAVVTSVEAPKETREKKSGYIPLSGDGDVTSCPSNVTNQVTETSDLASLSSDHERIALLVQRGEAEGAMSANESVVLNSGRSDSERPLLMASAASSSDDRLEEAAKTDVDEQGHSNPLMASFTDDGDCKKRGCPSSMAQSVVENPQTPVYTAVQLSTPVVYDADEKSQISQLRAQFVFLILFCLTWLSALCVVARPFRTILPHYDELVSSLCYALFSAATGLHAVLYHLLTRKDVCFSCFEPRGKEQTEIPAVPEPVQQPALSPYATLSREANQDDEVDCGIVDPALADALNVTVMDPSMIVNSFYDPRQSKTARRFFQKQRLLQQMQNNQLHRRHHHHHRHSSGHSINNAPSSYRSHSSHSPITEEALLNASSSSKTKVSNVNIHVEMGAYDWHELQSRISDTSWSKSGKQLPENSRTESYDLVEECGPRFRPDKTKRKRHVVHHQRATKKSKWEDQYPAPVVANRLRFSEEPFYDFVNDDYTQPCKALTEEDAHLKWETSV